VNRLQREAEAAEFVAKVLLIVVAVLVAAVVIK
jgi:hypothetical protein